jgi:hypothetical protein
MGTIDLSLGLKRQRSGNQHSLPSNTEVKNGGGIPSFHLEPRSGRRFVEIAYISA